MEESYNNILKSPNNDIDHHSNHATTEVSREEILRTIFGDVGDLINDFSCAVESTVLLHGRMYITNRFLCFYSNLFGLEKKIRVPYSHITLITKENTALVIPNAIAVTTHRKEYLFRSFWDRDECFKLLQEMISRHRHDSDADSRLRAGSRATAFPVDTSTTSISNGNRKSGYIYNAKNSTAITNGQQTVTTTALTTSTITSPVASSNVPGTLQTPNVTTTVISPDEECETETETGLVDGTPTNTTDYSETFKEEISRCKLKATVISDSLPISLKDFYTLFIEDTAQYSWKSYHESVGDTKVEVTNWTELSSTLGMGREMKFVKPIPSIKSSTRGVKVQRFRRFGDYGFVICSSTRLEDVPAADSFSVEDVISIKALGDNKIAIDIYFEVKFIKSTMFRYVIESSTNGEMIKWIEAFFNKLKFICNQRIQNQNKPTSLPEIISSGSTDANTTTPVLLITPRATANEPIEVSNVSTNASTSLTSKNSTYDDILNKIDSYLESLGMKGGRIYWSSYLLLLVIFVYFGYQYQSLHIELNQLTNKINNIEKLLIDLQNNK